MEIKLPAECTAYEYGTGIRPEGAHLGYAMRVRMQNDGSIRTLFFRDHDIVQLDTKPEKFYQRYAGIKKVLPSGRLRCWRNQKRKYVIRLG